MSDTPRTDAAAFPAQAMLRDTEVVGAEHARILEREVAALRADMTNVATLIIDNDREAAVKWAKGVSADWSDGKLRLHVDVPSDVHSAPSGWRLRREGDGIVVEHSGHGGWFADPTRRDDSIANTILYRLANDMLAAGDVPADCGEIAGRHYPTLGAIYESLEATGFDLKGMRGTIMGCLADARALGRREAQQPHARGPENLCACTTACVDPERQNGSECRMRLGSLRPPATYGPNGGPGDIRCAQTTCGCMDLAGCARLGHCRVANPPLPGCGGTNDPAQGGTD